MAQAPRLLLKDAYNPANWDMNMLEFDIAEVKSPDDADYPLETLAFPVVTYGFGAAGAGPLYINTPYKVAGSYFMVGKHDYNEDEFPENETHRTFFQILVLTDTLDTENFTTINNAITSRNHPDYFGQGVIQTKTHKIDYLAFHRPDHSSYAVVGTRLFDLKDGETILLAPQKDASVRFLQLDTPRLFSGEVQTYFLEQISQGPIRRFFEQKGNIDAK